SPHFLRTRTCLYFMVQSNHTGRRAQGRGVDNSKTPLVYTGMYTDTLVRCIVLILQVLFGSGGEDRTPGLHSKHVTYSFHNTTIALNTPETQIAGTQRVHELASNVFEPYDPAPPPMPKIRAYQAAIICNYLHVLRVLGHIFGLRCFRNAD